MTLFFRKKKRPPECEPEPALEQQFPDAESWILEIMRSVRPYTMTSPQRILALCEAVCHVVRNDIPGDFVECGVWRGGSMAAVARVLVHLGQTGRRLWLYDTFDGMTDPDDHDVDFLGRPAAALMQQSDRDDAQSIWCRSPLDGVREVMRETQYPTDRVTFVPGDVARTLGQHRPDEIALLRLDTDWYESTRCELDVLYPRLQAGGVLIIDDYGHWQGCRRAVDEYFDSHNVAMLLHRIDYTGRVGVKPAGLVGGTGKGARHVA